MNMAWVAAVIVVVTAVMGFAFRPSLQASATFYVSVLGAYVLLGGAALHRMWHDGTLLDKLRPRWGDLSIGAVTAMALLFGSWGARAVLAPAGTPRQSWVFYLYLQIGSSEFIQTSLLITLSIVLTAALEEIVWRGLVLEQLSERFGTRRAWPLAAIAYGAVHLPTLWTLKDPVAGMNPLLVTAALGCGIVWTFVAAYIGRLPPVIISHVAFTYFSATQFRTPGM
jgi:hypothetical protein